MLLHLPRLKGLFQSASKCAAFPILLVLGFATPGTSSPAQGWKPNKNVELIVGVSPGGARDRTLRVIQKIIEEEKLIDVPSTVINKPGAASAIAWTYLNQHLGDGHYLSITSPQLLTNHMLGRSSLTYTDFNSIVLLDNEYIVFVVRGDSPIGTGRDLVSRLKQDPASVTVSIGTGLGNTNHLALASAMRVARVDYTKMKTVVFSSSADAATAVLGGHVDLAVSAASSFVPLMQAGKMRAIAVSSPHRLGGVFAVVPTWKEQGVDSVFGGWHGIIGPKGLTPAQVAYWEAIFEKVSQTPAWKQDLESNVFVSRFMKSAQSTAYMKEQDEIFRNALSGLGLIK